MIAFALGDTFAALHAADGDIGVVMCAAQGFEELCGRKDWRLLADQIAALGLPALRFDLPGTADALGSDRDPGRLRAWQQGLDRAIGWMRRELGVRRIVLAGVRMGGALAALAAAGRDDVAGLVLLNPVVSGKAHARELGVMARMIAPSPDDPSRDGIEIAGFPVTSETLKDIFPIDLLQLSRAPAPRVMICAPEGGAGAAGLAQRCADLGSEVAQADFPRYQDWLGDPTLSRAPEEAFASVVDWLARCIAPRARTRAKRPLPLPARIIGPGFAEEALQFGPGGRLFGILCQPLRPDPGAAAVVIANAGRNHHIGWARGSVELARTLAAQGTASLRLDIAGIGDSADVPGRDPQVMYCPEPIGDISAALDALQARGHARFCLAGSCSGAHLAYHAALADARIGQLVMVNMQKFIWKPGYSLGIAMREAYKSNDHYKRRFLQADTWRRLLRGNLRLAGISRALAGRVAGKAAALLRRGGDGAAVRAGFRQLSRRGVEILLVYSIGDGGIDELALHFGAGGRGLARIPGAAVATIAEADHNLTSRPARERLAGLVQGFLGPRAALPVHEVRPDAAQRAA